MIAGARHVPLRPTAWDASAAAAAIAGIGADANANFGGDAFWPAHPCDDGVSDGHSSVYMGAAGVIWALGHLERCGRAPGGPDFRPYLPRLLERTRAEMAEYGELSTSGSLLLGDMGTALSIMRLAPSPAIADLIHARAEANSSLPVRELMWGLPGSMLACLSMAELTGEPRWRRLYETQADRLLADLDESGQGPMWVQDLYGSRKSYLGPVHGWAGNLIPLLRGWDWLTPAQQARLAEAVPCTLAKTACYGDAGATWHPTVGRDEPLPSLCQHCHGAPGMVTALADAPFASPVLEALLVDGGRFTWGAGPLAKGSNLCHGTGGNGYAFLKLHRRTGDAVWLERARAFAMTAIAQCREAREEHGRGRYSLWTGDVGLAIYLQDCIEARPRFPFADIV